MRPERSQRPSILNYFSSQSICLKSWLGKPGSGPAAGKAGAPRFLGSKPWKVPEGAGGHGHASSPAPGGHEGSAGEAARGPGAPARAWAPVPMRAVSWEACGGRRVSDDLGEARAWLTVLAADGRVGNEGPGSSADSRPCTGEAKDYLAN